MFLRRGKDLDFATKELIKPHHIFLQKKTQKE